tara:strand:- start:371 stop:793 length:423 start_codon:yes stop_codon:yes gene_type:complete
MGRRGLIYIYYQDDSESQTEQILYIHQDSPKRLLAARKMFLKTRTKKQVEKVCEKLLSTTEERAFEDETGNYQKVMTPQMCWPSIEASLAITVSPEEEIFVNFVNEVVIPEGIDATDDNAEKEAFWKHLKGQRVQRRHLN